jgi:hypothetical protein
MTMGKYLSLLGQSGTYDKNDINDKSPPFCRLNRFCRTTSEQLRDILNVLDARCPDLVEPERWRQAVDDGWRFLAQWGEQAGALGWTARDLFGLAPVPNDPHPNYKRFSRYDQTGLVWLLRGRPVIALTEKTAAIEATTGSVTIYRRERKPAFGPLGDSLDDFK